MAFVSLSHGCLWVSLRGRDVRKSTIYGRRKVAVSRRRSIGPGSWMGVNESQSNGSHSINDVSKSSWESSGAVRSDASKATVDAAVHEVPVSDLKCELLAATASTNRGLAASSEARIAVETLVEQLERSEYAQEMGDVTQKPSLFTGKWRLIYTNALDVLSLGLLSPVAALGEVYQNIYSATDVSRDFDVENVVELEPFIAPVANKLIGRTMTRLVVKITGAITNINTVRLTFQRVAIRQEFFAGFNVGSRLPVLSSPLPGRATGELETTFVDEDLRISRTAPGSRPSGLFVLFRET